MLSRLGEISFEALFAPTSLEGTFATDYAEHALIGVKPRLQRTGDKLDEWRVGLRLHQRFCNPKESLDALQTLRTNGQAVPFVLGLDYRGWFVIPEIIVTYTDVNTQGVLLCAELQITLREYTGVKEIIPEPLAIQSLVPPVPTVNARKTQTIEQVIDGEQPLKQAELALIKQHQAFAKIRKAAAAIQAIQNIANAPDKLVAIVSALPALSSGAKRLADSHRLFAKIPALVGLTGQIANAGAAVNNAKNLLNNGLTLANVASRLSGASTELTTATAFFTGARTQLVTLASRVAAREVL